MSRLKDGEFKTAIKKALQFRAGNLCSICNRLTTAPKKGDSEFVLIGQAAHINGLGYGAHFRYDSKLDFEYLSDFENGI